MLASCCARVTDFLRMVQNCLFCFHVLVGLLRDQNWHASNGESTHVYHIRSMYKCTWTISLVLCVITGRQSLPKTDVASDITNSRYKEQKLGRKQRRIEQRFGSELLITQTSECKQVS